MVYRKVRAYRSLMDMDKAVALVILSVFRIAWECLMVMEYQLVSAHHRMLDNQIVPA